MLIPRIYDIGKLLKPQKVLVIYGPRRVGKTTMLQDYLNSTQLKYKLDIGDNIRTQQILGSQDFSQILEYAQGYELIAIDEAQQIPNIGMGLKIIIDQIPNIKVIATGSSSFDLSHQIGEPLTGRKNTVTLFPISQLELSEIYNKHELRERLNEFLIFGVYPEVLTAKTKQEKVSIIEEIVNSYLLKDVLSLEKIKGSKVLLDLLKLLAFQLGSEVSLNELSMKLGIDIKTVARYLDLLEKSFVILSLGGLSRNLRSEITSKNKYFFLDNGIRNGIIAQFNGLDMRDDGGKLWENFVVVERLKKRSYKGIYSNQYFWRTYSQQEIDLVEDRDGKLFGYECKWSNKKKVVAPKDWITSYPQAAFAAVTPKNYLNFIA
ncbi:MAG: ATP-binding protein [Candidatus Levyibacteriota bacterium]|nr:MAG: ATP-binding protein [Candidatus Levybacteria bacterium]